MELSKKDLNEKSPLSAIYTPSSLELKLKRQRGKVRRSLTESSTSVVTTAPKKTSLISSTRLQIPHGSKGYQKLKDAPLIEIQSESSEEEFSNSYVKKARQVRWELSRQLEKDGFRLDEMTDDEDLDLIPPSDFRETQFCSCCNDYRVSCTIL